MPQLPSDQMLLSNMVTLWTYLFASCIALLAISELNGPSGSGKGKPLPSIWPLRLKYLSKAMHLYQDLQVEN